MLRTSLSLALAATTILGASAAAYSGPKSHPIDPSHIIIDLLDNVWLGAHDDYITHDFAGSGDSAVFDVRSNDVVTEVPKEDVSVIIEDAPLAGTVSVLEDGSVEYQASDAAAFTADSFTYHLNYQGKTSEAATVVIAAN